MGRHPRKTRNLKLANWNKLVDIVATLLEIDPARVTPELGPDTLEAWDSLNHLSICTAVSQEFGLELTTPEMLSIRKVSDLVGLLQVRGVEM